MAMNDRVEILLYPPLGSALLIVIFVVLFMAALWNRAGHYIFILWLLLSIFLLSSSFLSSPNLSGRILYVYHTSTHGVA